MAVNAWPQDCCQLVFARQHEQQRMDFDLNPAAVHLRLVSVPL